MPKNWKGNIIECPKINPNVCKDVLYDKTAISNKERVGYSTKDIETTGPTGNKFRSPTQCFQT